MKNRKVSVFVLSRIDYIENMQRDGWTLKYIHEDLQKEFGEEFSFFTFRTSVARARQKKNDKNYIDNKINKVFKKDDSKNIQVNTNHHENKDAVSKLKDEIDQQSNDKDFNF